MIRRAIGLFLYLSVQVFEVARRPLPRETTLIDGCICSDSRFDFYREKFYQPFRATQKQVPWGNSLQLARASLSCH